MAYLAYALLECVDVVHGYELGNRVHDQLAQRKLQRMLLLVHNLPSHISY